MDNASVCQLLEGGDKLDQFYGLNDNIDWSELQRFYRYNRYAYTHMFAIVVVVVVVVGVVDVAVAVLLWLLSHSVLIIATSYCCYLVVFLHSLILYS